MINSGRNRGGKALHLQFPRHYTLHPRGLGERRTTAPPQLISESGSGARGQSKVLRFDAVPSLICRASRFLFSATRRFLPPPVSRRRTVFLAGCQSRFAERHEEQEHFRTGAIFSRLREPKKNKKKKPATSNKCAWMLRLRCVT